MAGDLIQTVVGNICHADAVLCGSIQVYTVIADSGGADYAAFVQPFYYPPGIGSREGYGYYCVCVMRCGDNLIFAMAGNYGELRTYISEESFFEGCTGVLED